MSAVCVLALVLACVCVSRAHRYGADPTACDTMKPGHGANVRQTRATPYIIDTNMAGYVPCENQQQRDCGVVVRIRGRMGAVNGGMFKGFILQARHKSADGRMQYIGEYRYTNGQAVTPRNNANQAQQAMMAGQFGGPGPQFGRKKRQVGPGGVGPGGFPGGMGGPGGMAGPGGVGGPGMGGMGPGGMGVGGMGVGGMGPGGMGVGGMGVGGMGVGGMGINGMGGQFAGVRVDAQGGRTGLGPVSLNNIVSNVMVQRMQCVRGSAVTHTESGPKNSVTLVWTPPVGFQGGVQFVATIVQDYNTFWMAHRSRELRPRRALRNRPGGGLPNTARWFVNGATHASTSAVVMVTALLSAVLCFLR